MFIKPVHGIDCIAVFIVLGVADIFLPFSLAFYGQLTIILYVPSYRMQQIVFKQP